jgi:hypothetical protein
MYGSRTTERLLASRSRFSDPLCALEGIGTKGEAVGRDGYGISGSALTGDGDAVVVEVVARVSVVRRIDDFVEGDPQHIDGPADAAGYARGHELAEANVLAGSDTFQAIELHVDGLVIKPNLLCVVVVVA